MSDDIILQIIQLRRDAHLKMLLLRAILGYMKMARREFRKDKISTIVLYFPQYPKWFVVLTGIDNARKTLEKWSDPLEFIIQLKNNGFTEVLE